MDGPTLGFAAFLFLFGSALVGVFAHAHLPPQVLTRQARSFVGRGITMIAVLAALLLASTTVYVVRQFDVTRRDVGHFSAQLIEIDHQLRQAGPAAVPVRELLFRYAARTLKDVWPDSQPRLGPDGTDAGQLLNQLEDAVTALHPADPAAQAATARARSLVRNLIDTGWNLEPNQSSLLSPWLTVMLLFWLMLTFAGLGLVAPRTRLALLSLSLCAAAVGGGMFLMADYASAFGGLILIPSEPLQNALFVMTGGG